MDEDLAVKAPVTRLRRRMSVEAEDSPLPSTPSTPTKKRTTRLAAKPQLELIDEVATENVLKKTTRKDAVKENEAEPNVGTPTAVTPSRRSTRIRSNTSILSETTAQNVESPRAKRAIRRTSQLGSDTESSAVTPARQTRRAAKDSSANTDKPAAVRDENVVLYTVTSTNTEDSEKNTPKDSKVNGTANHSPPSRKSPRLRKKGGKVDDDTDKANKESNETLDDSVNALNIIKPLNDSIPVKNTELNKKNEASPKINNSEEKISTSNHQQSSIDLINEIETKTNNALNKSTSAIEKIANDLKNKRNRTKSWTTLSSASNAGFISDNEEAKDKSRGIRGKDKCMTPNTRVSGGGDALSTRNTSKLVCEPDAKSPKKSVNTSTTSILKTITPCVVSLTRVDSHKSDTVKLFENSPSNQLSYLLIEDSDSCSDGKLIIDTQVETGDQCVPEVADPTESPKKHEHNTSVEPMDIDESVPANVTIDDFSDKSNTSKEDVNVPEKRKSSVSEKSMLKDDSINTSKRKSSVSIQTASESLKFSMTEENKNETINKSKNSSKMCPSPSIYKLNDSTNDKTNKSSSFSRVSGEIDSSESKKLKDKPLRKSSIGDKNNANQDKSANNSKIKSAVSQNNSVNQNDSNTCIDNTQKNLPMNVENKGNIENLSNNSSISLDNCGVNQKSIIDDNNDSKNSKKSKRNSISQTDSPSLENGSTLVISHLKDVSKNDTNKTMSPNVPNNALSKSLNGPDLKTKESEKKNLSLNYLTSTPIQQKSLQKLAMQINTSIISPAVDNTNEKTPKKDVKEESSDSDTSDKTDEEIKFKNKEEVVVFPKNKFKLSKAPSSSDSSDDESDTESRPPIKKLTKKSPIKKQPESSDSEEESGSNTQQIKKNTPSRKCKSRLKTEAMSVKTLGKALSSDSSDTADDSDKNTLKDRSKMIDDEASEASDDYKSGDSQNEKDRRYEEQNEIIEKGETLDSEEDISNDSDYEKDSFLVSSDADDHDMLSGTGDDLSMSDNELTISAKSKKKFNERNLKQQKKASREMYEARHKKDESADSLKSTTATSKKTKRRRLESSNLESEIENTDPKKSHRLRIDSSQDSNTIKSDADESIVVKKKKSKRLSESVHDTTTNEKEVTVCNQSTTEKIDPLSVAIKQEPKTPQNNFDIPSVVINDNIEEVKVEDNASILGRNETLDPLQATLVDDDSSSSGDIEIFERYDSVLSSLSTQRYKIKTADTSLNLNRKSKKSKNPVIDQLNLTQTTKSKINKTEPEENKFTESFKSQAKDEVIKDEENSSDSIDMKLLFPEDSNDSEINASQFKPKDQEVSAENFIPLKRTDAQTNIPGNTVLDIPVNSEESEDNNIKIIVDTTGTHEELETSQVLTNSSKKKKKNKSLNVSKALEIAVDIDCTDGVVETPAEASIGSERKKKKNKNKSFDVSVNNVESCFTVTEGHSAKKSKKKSESTSEFVETLSENTDNTIVEAMPDVSIKSDKKKKKNKLDVSQIIEPVVEATSSAKKKSKKTSLCVEEVAPQTQDAELEEVPAETSMKSEKKKKKKNKQNLEVSQIEDKTGEESDDAAPVEVSYRSEKKSDATDTATDEALTSVEKKKHKKNKKKNKKNKKLTQSIEKTEDDDVMTKEQGDNGSTKRKRKTSGTSEMEDITNVVAINSLTINNEKKKRKIQQDTECVENIGEEGSSKKSKKNKELKNHDTINQEEVPQQHAKKRKHRDDDNEQKVSKVSKQNSFDNIHVPTLPKSVISQLTEMPQNKHHKKKETKIAAIATMPFVVEEAERRKNKPSNYLEQSVYLNDTPVKTKQKRIKDKPKVLPFIPTALTSDSGYTGQFNINVLPRDTQFVAQASNVKNFKESFLVTQRIKKLGTFERFKARRCHKISKF